MVDNVFGNASADQVADAPAAMGGQGNQVTFYLTRKIVNTILLVNIIVHIQGVVF